MTRFQVVIAVLCGGAFLLFLGLVALTYHKEQASRQPRPEISSSES